MMRMSNRYIGSATAGSRWPDPLRGPWSVTVHWGEQDGKAIPIGFDVRAFRGTPGSEDDPPRPLAPRSAPWTPLTAEMVRSLQVGALVDDSRANLAAMTEWFEQQPAPARRAATARSKVGAKRLGRPRDRDDAHYALVADLYRHAVATGDRAPAKAVTERLVEQGVRFSSVNDDAKRAQTRKWIAEARRRGLIPTAHP